MTLLPVTVESQVRGGLAEFDIEPTEIVAVWGEDRWAARPRAFRVVAADGRRWKLHIAHSAAAAQRASTIATQLDDRRIPAPVARSGRLTLVGWIEGTDGAHLPPNALLGDAASLLAWLHSRAGGRAEALPQMRSTDAIRRKAERQLDRLVHASVVDAPLAAAAAGALAERLPPRSRWGLTHLDLCPGNLVREPSGRLVSVDNEQLRRSFLGFDLGRAWCRWPLDDQLESRFRDAYVAAGGVRVSDAELSAWRIVAAIRGLAFRNRMGAPVAVSHDRLRAAADQTRRF